MKKKKTDTLFQIPICPIYPWPWAVGTRLFARGRPWWGIGEVVNLDGQCAVRWTSNGVVGTWRYNDRDLDELRFEVVP